IHALLIGIDKYEADKFKNLRSAVSDMQNVKSFLEGDLHVSTDLITVLQNEAATYEGIITALKDLASSTNNIQKDSPILIYFSGHGSTATPPDGSTIDSRIQVLVPYDASPDGERFLTDCKFGKLLHDLADEKGDNITVILDCCHSGSGTR
ncbi:peptidase C14, caspase domain-containing protein, partial [Vararia minispora EC-137]